MIINPFIGIHMSIILKVSLLMLARPHTPWHTYIYIDNVYIHCLVRLYVPFMLVKQVLPLWHWHNGHLTYVRHNDSMDCNSSNQTWRAGKSTIKMDDFPSQNPPEMVIWLCCCSPSVAGEVLNYILHGCIRLDEGCIVLFNICCSEVFEWSRPLVFPCGGLKITSYSSRIDFDSILWGWPMLEVSCLLCTQNLISKEVYDLSFSSTDSLLWVWNPPLRLRQPSIFPNKDWWYLRCSKVIPGDCLRSVDHHVPPPIGARLVWTHQPC